MEKFTITLGSIVNRNMSLDYKTTALSLETFKMVNKSIYINS